MEELQILKDRAMKEQACQEQKEEEEFMLIHDELSRDIA